MILPQSLFLPDIKMLLEIKYLATEDNLKKYLLCIDSINLLPSVLWHPACKKLEWWGAGVVVCLE